jgi:hypothetical protein
LWGIYTVPNVERAQILFDRAKLIDPGNNILPQAEMWLTNEKYRLPHPPGGYSLFPPDGHLALHGWVTFEVPQTAKEFTFEYEGFKESLNSRTLH